jgi:hypothetical protein
MSFAVISVLATLALVLALNWSRLREMGWERAGRMLLIWLGIFAGLGVVLRLLGY